MTPGPGQASGRLVLAVAVLACLVVTSATGQRPGASARPAPLRLGVFFWHESPNDEAALVGICEGLAAAGREHELWIERAGEDPAAARRMLTGLVARGADLVFAMGTQAALRAREHVRTRPVVYTAVTNPVESGVVPSWAGSGSNLAGNSNWIPPATTLRVFRMAVPGLARLGVVRSRDGVVSRAELAGLRAHVDAHEAGGLRIEEAIVDDADGLVAAVERLVAGGAEAIWVPIDALVYDHTTTVFGAARRHGVPVVSSSLRGTRSGATAGVVVDYAMLGRRAAAMALEIVDGGRDPGALPVGTMRGYRVVVNLAAARATGHVLPLSSLLLADELLEEVDGDG